MEITDRILEETELIKELVKSVHEADEKEALDLTERMRKNQPFIVELLMAASSEVTEEQFEDILELYCVTYMFFEQKTNIKKATITEEIFSKQYELNLQFIDYFSEEETEEDQMELGALDLSRMHYKSLYTSMIYLMDGFDSFESKDEELKGGILLIMKSLIECMEANLLD